PIIGTPAETADQVGLAYNLSVKGNVQVGETVRVSFYDDVPAPPTPPQPAPPSGDATAAAGDTVTVSWPAYTCPDGYALSGYNATVNNAATTVNGTSVDVAIPAAAVPGDTFNVVYTAMCTEFESPPSAAHTITVE